MADDKLPDLDINITVEPIETKPRKLTCSVVYGPTRCGEVSTIGGLVRLHECEATFPGIDFDQMPKGWQVRFTESASPPRGYMYAVCPAHAVAKASG